MARKKLGDKAADVARRESNSRQRAKAALRRSPSDLVDHALMKALSSSLRAQILAILVERIASPKELAFELEEALSSVSYHVGVLHKCGVIELDHKIPRRGAVEHFYKAIVPTLIPPEAWDNLPPAMQKAVSMYILREFFDDASSSMEAGIFDDPSGELSWTPLILDARGVEEIGELAGEFLKSVLRVQIEASKRLSKSKRRSKKNSQATTEAISMTVFLASFLSARSPEEGKKASAAKRR